MADPAAFLGECQGVELDPWYAWHYPIAPIAPIVPDVPVQISAPAHVIDDPEIFNPVESEPENVESEGGQDLDASGILIPDQDLLQDLEDIPMIGPMDTDSPLTPQRDAMLATATLPLCVHCTAKPATVVAIPACGNLVLCQECFTLNVQSNAIYRRCPVCREEAWVYTQVRGWEL